MTLDRAPAAVAGHWAFPLGLGRLPPISAPVALFFFASAARAFLRAAGGMVTFVLDIARSLSFGADSSQALIYRISGVSGCPLPQMCLGSGGGSKSRGLSRSIA